MVLEYSPLHPAAWLDRCINRGVRRDDNNSEPGSLGKQGWDQIKSIGGPKSKINQGKIEGPSGSLMQGILGIADGNDRVAFCFQADGERFPCVEFVVNNKDIQSR